MVLGDTDGYLADPDKTDPNLEVLLWLFFVMASSFMVIIMLNLLISIISDTYAQVVGSNALASNFERALMINEYEKSMEEEERKKLLETIYLPYLFFAECPDNEINEIDLNSKIDNIDELMVKIEDDVSQKVTDTKNSVKKCFETYNIENQEIYKEILALKSEAKKSNKERHHIFHKIKDSFKGINSRINELKK